VSFQELSDGLSRWTGPHPSWGPGRGWEPTVSSYFVAAEEAALLIDPLLPETEDDRVWEALDERVGRLGRTPDVLLTRAGHFRSSQRIVDRYCAEVWGHQRARDRVSPQSAFNEIAPGVTLPGGVSTLPSDVPGYDGAPLYLPSHAAVAVGDIILAIDDELRVWWVAEDEEDRRWYREHVIPALASWLEHPIAHVLVAHGDYVPGGRDALTEALKRPPWDVS
jgi:hypothetical protein